MKIVPEAGIVSTALMKVSRTYISAISLTLLIHSGVSGASSGAKGAVSRPLIRRHPPCSSLASTPAARKNPSKRSAPDCWRLSSCPSPLGVAGLAGNPLTCLTLAALGGRCIAPAGSRFAFAAFFAVSRSAL